MGAIVNGLLIMVFRPSGATFAVFADYMRPSVRLSALMGAHLPYLTHDSVAVGEDGPTHQPVETTSGYGSFHLMCPPSRSRRNCWCFRCRLERTDGPTGLILTRQNVPNLSSVSADRREGVLKGGYIARKEEGEFELIILPLVVS